MPHIDIDVVLYPKEQEILTAGRPAPICKPYTEARNLGLTCEIVQPTQGGVTVRLTGTTAQLTAWQQSFHTDQYLTIDD